jgi:predicted transcriptional regulator
MNDKLNALEDAQGNKERKAREKNDILKEKHDKELIKLLKTGNLKLVDGFDKENNIRSSPLYRIFELPKVALIETQTKEYHEKRDELRLEAERLLDEIVLGDEKEALKLLRNFENK